MAKQVQRLYAIRALNRYWPRNEERLVHLPVLPVRVRTQTGAECPAVEESALPPNLADVSLPAWAHDIGIQGQLLIPAFAIMPGEGPEWQRVDWFAAIFWFLNGTSERAHERRAAPIHSYSFRLKGWDPRLWQRAWVNRIALFLRRWAAVIEEKKEEDLFGPLPQPDIVLTHDVDAIQKTPVIRLKQSLFHVFNAVRSLRRGNPDNAGKKMRQGVRFLLRSEDYWCFERIITLEERCGVRSCFHVYGGRGGWGRRPREILFDPSYNVLHPQLRRQLRALSQGGWQIGLHQSFNAWCDADAMRSEKTRLEQALEAPVTICRQHWLRFSWQQTWPAQQQAGLATDTTLGFNDRPGFRNGAALRFHPWDEAKEEPMTLAALPMVLMDSHLYDYYDLDEDGRRQQITYWLDEIRAVHGAATIIWHQHAMNADYGWDAGYEYLLSQIMSRQ